MEGLGPDLRLTERYARQIMLPEVGEEGQRRLAEASVLVVGVGGLGSAVSLYLTAAGIGRIGLVDDDRVSLSNLQRQVLYTEAEVGECKALCARRRLQALSPHTRIDAWAERLTPENAGRLVAPYDLVVDGCDNFATRYLIDEVCHRQGKPYVYGSIGEFHGQVSVFGYRGGMRYRDLFPEREELSAVRPKVQGVLGTTPGFIGCLEASEVLKIVSGIGNVLRNRLFTIDLLTMESRTIDL